MVKKNIKNTTQKQKQKKAKQQQQQQQGQNVKININVGNKPARRKPATKKPPPKQPPRPPAPQLSTPTPQYVPMHVIQQPAQYFTPPVSAPSIPVAPPGSAISSLVPTTNATAPPIAPVIAPTIRTRPPPPPPRNQPTIVPISGGNPPSIELDTFRNFTPSQNIISNLISFTDLDEPNSSSSFKTPETIYTATDLAQEAVRDFNLSKGTTLTDNETQTYQPMTSYAETQTYQPSYSDVGIQFDGFLPQIPNISSVFSNAIASPIGGIAPIPIPPPLPVAQLPPPQIIPKEFTSPTQDIQQSYIQQIGTLTQENLRKVGGVAPNREYEPSEISDISSASVNTDISNMIMNQIRNRIIKADESNIPVKSIDERVKENLAEIEREKNKLENKEGMYGDLARKIDEMRKYMKPEETEEEEDNEWNEEELSFTTKPKSVPMEPEEQPKPNLQRKPGSGRPKGSGNKTIREREIEDEIKKEKQIIKRSKRMIKELKKNDLEEDERGISITDYELEISDAENRLNFWNDELEQEKSSRIRLPQIEEEGEEDDDDTNDIFA
jgi:hypothetical protein